jgi:phage shock protein PspC (stress-responsive transcriptional regulator)
VRTRPVEEEQTAAAPDSDRQRRGRRPRLGERQRDVIALAMIAVVFLIPLRGLLRAPGPPMEEGFMLVFPERVLHGDVPNRDFLHLYGPGSLWALAGAFKVFGVSLLTERIFGLLQQMAVVFGVFAIARAWGRRLAVCCALTSAVIIIPFGLTALAWVGGIGLALLGLASALRARSTRVETQARRWAVIAGVLLGVAVLFRLDLALAVGLAVLALCWELPRSRTTRLLGGIAAGVAPYAIHLAMAGPGNAVRGMILDPLIHLRGGRSLPIPPSWSHLDGFLQRSGAFQQIPWPLPSLSASKELFLWFFLLLLVDAFLLVVGWRVTRANPGSSRARALLVVALFSAGLLPQAIQRVDSAHFAWVGCVSFGFLPLAVFEAIRRLARRAEFGRVALASGAAVLAIVLVVIPTFTFRRYGDYTLQTFGFHRNSYLIERNRRVFYYGKQDRAAAANMVIAAAARISKPGQRLFVGPVNLRKTPYSDAFLYYMLPELRPATYYIEMDPGVANADNSRLPNDLASADVVILSSIWDNWNEPNGSRKVGSPKAEQVLAREFCRVGNYLGNYQLYRRCQPRSG